MGDISPHFDSNEFRSRDGVRHPSLAVMYRLAAHLEVLRCITGHKALVIVSGYRTPAHNKTVGGALNSRHVAGDAVDLHQGVATVAQAERAGFMGIGSRGQWATHVDLRPLKARWTYGPAQRTLGESEAQGVGC